MLFSLLINIGCVVLRCFLSRIVNVITIQCKLMFVILAISFKFTTYNYLRFIFLSLDLLIPIL